MAIVKTWEINKLERDLSDGFVNTAIYRVKAIDDSDNKEKEGIEKRKTSLRSSEMGGTFS